MRNPDKTDFIKINTDNSSIIHWHVARGNRAVNFEMGPFSENNGPRMC